MTDEDIACVIVAVITLLIPISVIVGIAIFAL